jgi:hypothetical protein
MSGPPLPLNRYQSKLAEEPLTEMKRRHFIMLSKGREDMRLYLVSLGMSPSVGETVEVEKAFYLTALEGEVLGLEGPFEEDLRRQATLLVALLENPSETLAEKQRGVLSYLAFVEGGRESGEGHAALTRIVNQYLDALKQAFDILPPALQNDGRAAASAELQKWAGRLERCGMTLDQAKERVYGSD